MSAPKESAGSSRYRGFETIPINVTVRIGTTRLSLGQLSELKNEEILRLDRAVGEPFELIARGVPLGEVELVASDESIALKLLAPVENDDESPA